MENIIGIQDMGVSLVKWGTIFIVNLFYSALGYSFLLPIFRWADDKDSEFMIFVVVFIILPITVMTLIGIGILTSLFLSGNLIL